MHSPIVSIVFDHFTGSPATTSVRSVPPGLASARPPPHPHQAILCPTGPRVSPGRVRAARAVPGRVRAARAVPGRVRAARAVPGRVRAALERREEDQVTKGMAWSARARREEDQVKRARREEDQVKRARRLLASPGGFPD